MTRLFVLFDICICNWFCKWQVPGIISYSMVYAPIKFLQLQQYLVLCRFHQNIGSCSRKFPRHILNLYTPYSVMSRFTSSIICFWLNKQICLLVKSLCPCCECRNCAPRSRWLMTGEPYVSIKLVCFYQSNAARTVYTTQRTVYLCI